MARTLWIPENTPAQAGRCRIFRQMDGWQWQYLLEAAVYHSGDGGAVLPDAAALDGLDVSPLAAETEDLSYLAFCHRMRQGVRELAASGDWYRPHPWLSVFLPSGAVGQYVSGALETMSPQTLGPVPMLLYPLRRGPVPAPGLLTPDGDQDGLFWSFSILRTTDGTPEAAASALDGDRALARAAVQAGGTVYGISAT